MTSDNTWIDVVRLRMKAVRVLLDNQLPVNAINRIYYTVHASAKIMVNEKNSNPKTHQGVISEFGRLYVKASIIDIKYSRILQRLYSLREKVDLQQNVIRPLISPSKVAI